MLLDADLLACSGPDDVDTLRSIVLEQARALADIADAKGNAKGKADARADARIEKLQAIIDAFMRHRFGRRSEQLDPDQFELALEDMETALAEAEQAREQVSPGALPSYAQDQSRIPACPSGADREARGRRGQDLSLLCGPASPDRRGCLRTP